MGQIKYGVPQGSILGPFLFFIYINDIIRVPQTPDLILYADDTNIFFSGTSLEVLERESNFVTQSKPVIGAGCSYSVHPFCLVEGTRLIKRLFLVQHVGSILYPWRHVPYAETAVSQTRTPCQGFRYLLACVDIFTQWPDAITLSDYTDETVADAFVTHWVCRYGCLSIITTDRNGNFRVRYPQH